MEHHWRYSITTSEARGEKVTAFVDYDRSDKRYPEGQGEFVETVSAVVETDVCEDGLLHLSAGFEISTGLDSDPLGKHEDFNGLFYDPDNPGHGFDFNAHNEGLTIFYYGHTADGKRFWLVSETITEKLEFGRSYDVLMYEVTDGTFGQPVFPPSEWGRVLVTLSDCDNGQANFDGIDGQLSMRLVRLVSSGASSCE